MNRQNLRKFFGMFFIVIGAVCFFASYLFQRQPDTYWGYLCAVGVGFALLGVIHTMSDERKLPKPLVVCLHSLAAAGFASFAIILTLIITYGSVQDTQTPDVVLVLGAGLHEDQVSPSLQGRLDAAAKLLDDLPANVPVVVSGGQGKDEKISEAEAMQRYLVEHGVAAERIIKEDQSSSTHENMKFTKEILQEQNIKAETVTVVTNQFHIYRSAMLAKRAGFETIHCYGASMPSYLKPTYYLREYFAVLKSWVLDW